ncbi:MAG: 2'-deoxycytidine 5'-triphosphate deaminase, partial [candidate division Zixibacteria bacterium]|nr:2'-deoxycytidine 5'-triphosphate deaminase [candidate division Zixibacteria bacterium]
MSESYWSKWRPGILVKDQIKTLFENGTLDGHANDIDNSSVDLHLSSEGWEMNGSLKLKNNECFAEVLQSGNFKKRTLHLEDGPETLIPGKTYVFRLQESLKKLDPGLHLCGMATGKSSIGRLDVLTRLVVDGCDSYDCFEDIDSGLLYVEVTPITFPVSVREGTSLNQLRLFRGKPELCRLKEAEIPLFGDLIISDRSDKRDLSLDIMPVPIDNKQVVAFTARESRFLKPQDAIDLSQKRKHDPAKYWKTCTELESDSLLIQAELFYILRSKERFKLPGDIAVYCQAITENLGEIRIHYAGFVHPWFGFERPDGREGTPLIFEVRGHTVDAFLRNRELMARVEFYRTSKPTEFNPDEQSYNT